MQKILILITFISLLNVNNITFSQSPGGKEFGFGIIIGDPTGGTLKFWTQRSNAFVVDIGSSYYGSPRIGVDYLWHFEAFNSDIVKLYAGPGGVIGIGEGHGYWYRRGRDNFYFREGNEVGIAARGVFGVNIVPRATPLEFFFEIGVLLGLVPHFGSAVDAALGMRFYP